MCYKFNMGSDQPGGRLPRFAATCYALVGFASAAALVLMISIFSADGWAGPSNPRASELQSASQTVSLAQATQQSQSASAASPSAQSPQSAPAAPAPTQPPASAPGNAAPQTAPATIAPAATAQNALPPSAQNSPEMTTTDHDATLRVRSNLVLVRVVVRDAKGRSVSGLTKDDFTLYDEGKLQPITQFTAQIAGKFPGANASAASAGAAAASTTASPAPPGLPERYIGLYFDDVHVNLQDLQFLRLAALRYVTTVLRPEDRAGVFTSSGELQQDFTSDREKISAAIRRIMPRPLYNAPLLLCPDVGAYQAWLISIANDPNAINSAAYEIDHCQYNDNQAQLPQARAQAIGYAQSQLEQSNNEEIYTLRGLNGLVRRMASLPGERTAILLSPGFLSRDDLPDVSDLIDRALHSNVTINSLDVRGLYTPPMMGDISEDQGIAPISEGPRAVIENESAQVYSEPLAQIAYGTGGTLFQNNNDIDAGLRITAGEPGESYLLAFVPPPPPKSKNAAGEFHKLTIKLTPAAFRGYQVRARPGYFSNKPSPPGSSGDQEEIAEAVYSQQPYDELPFDVHTRFYTAGANGHAVLSVMAHLDTRALHFHQRDGRNTDSLTLVTALFDSDGNYLKGQEKNVEFRLRDATRASLDAAGITLKCTFDVSTGRYVVRSVVRDANGPSLAAATRTIEIP
jgi:VWFA-related protein